MEVYLLSLALTRHRTIVAHPRRSLSPSAALSTAEPNRNAVDATEIAIERQSFIAPLQRNPR
jgi:hypothetical protein